MTVIVNRTEVVVQPLPETVLVQAVPETVLVQAVPETVEVTTVPQTVLVELVPETVAITVEQVAQPIVLEVGAQGLQGIPGGGLNEAVVVYETGNVLYACKAAIGSIVSDSVWQIKRADTSVGVIVTWCDGDALYDNAATDLATVQGYSYS